MEPHPEDSQRENSPNPEAAEGFAEYQALGGTLPQPEYQRVIRRAASGVDLPTRSSLLAQTTTMAEADGITLSPETIAFYRILRDEKPHREKGHFSELTDQRLLAEALRLSGDEPGLTAFVKKHPHIFHT